VFANDDLPEEPLLYEFVNEPTKGMATFFPDNINPTHIQYCADGSTLELDEFDYRVCTLDEVLVRGDQQQVSCCDRAGVRIIPMEGVCNPCDEARPCTMQSRNRTILIGPDDSTVDICITDDLYDPLGVLAESTFTVVKPPEQGNIGSGVLRDTSCGRGIVYVPNQAWDGSPPPCLIYKVCESAESVSPCCCVPVTVVFAHERTDVTVDIQVTPSNPQCGDMVDIDIEVTNRTNERPESGQVSVLEVVTNVTLPGSLVYDFDESQPANPEGSDGLGPFTVTYREPFLVPGQTVVYRIKAMLGAPGGMTPFGAHILWKDHGMEQYNIQYPIMLPKCVCTDDQFPIIFQDYPQFGQCPQAPNGRDPVEISVLASAELRPGSGFETLQEIYECLDADDYSICDGPFKGTAVWSGDRQSIIYTPGENFDGTDEFKYCLRFDCDCEGCARVKIGCCIEAKDICVSTCQGVAVDVPVLESVIDPQGIVNPGCTSVSSPPKNGKTCVNSQTGVITYTPNSGFSGRDTFTYKVCETCKVCCDEATVTVNVAHIGSAEIDSRLSKKHT
jgi:hypothetical protein